MGINELDLVRINTARLTIVGFVSCIDYGILKFSGPHKLIDEHNSDIFPVCEFLKAILNLLYSRLCGTPTIISVNIYETEYVKTWSISMHAG